MKQHTSRSAGAAMKLTALVALALVCACSAGAPSSNADPVGSTSEAVVSPANPWLYACAYGGLPQTLTGGSAGRTATICLQTHGAEQPAIVNLVNEANAIGGGQAMVLVSYTVNGTCVVGGFCSVQALHDKSSGLWLGADASGNAIFTADTTKRIWFGWRGDRLQEVTGLPSSPGWGRMLVAPSNPNVLNAPVTWQTFSSDTLNIYWHALKARALLIAYDASIAQRTTYYVSHSLAPGENDPAVAVQGTDGCMAFLPGPCSWGVNNDGVHSNNWYVATRDSGATPANSNLIGAYEAFSNSNTPEYLQAPEIFGGGPSGAYVTSATLGPFTALFGFTSLQQVDSEGECMFNSGGGTTITQQSCANATQTIILPVYESNGT